MLGDLGGEGVLSLRVGEGSESDLGSWGCGFWVRLFVGM